MDHKLYIVQMYSSHAHYSVVLYIFPVTVVDFLKLNVPQLIWDESKSGGMARRLCDE